MLSPETFAVLWGGLLIVTPMLKPPKEPEMPKVKIISVLETTKHDDADSEKTSF